MINQRQRYLEYTTQRVRETSQQLQRFAQRVWVPSTLFGHTVALLMTILLTRRLLVEFQRSVGKVRAGASEGKQMIEVKHRSKISAIQIPKMVTMLAPYRSRDPIVSSCDSAFCAEDCLHTVA